MEYRNLLKNNLSRQLIDNVALSVYDNISDFQIVYNLIFDDDKKVAWRAAWACEKMIQKFPEFVDDNKKEQLISLAISTNHPGLHRLSLSILNSLSFGNSIPVELLNSCFEWISSDKQTIAVQALSLKLLLKFCIIEPDLKQELIAYLTNIDLNNLSPGMVSTCRNALKQLNKNHLHSTVYKYKL